MFSQNHHQDFQQNVENYRVISFFSHVSLNSKKAEQLTNKEMVHFGIRATTSTTSTSTTTTTATTNIKLFIITTFAITILLSQIPSVDATYLTQAKCTNRFELRHEIKNRSFTGCQEVIRENPLCGEDVVVAWTEYPPYIFRSEHTGNISGILPSKL